MDPQLNKPLTTASPLEKGLHVPLMHKEPLHNKPLLATPSDKLLAGQSSAAGGISSLPSASGFVTYTESTLEPIITIKEVSAAPIITSTPSASTLLPGEQRLRSDSPLDLERFVNKPLLGEKSPRLENTGLGYERKLDTHLDQKLEGPSLSRQAGADLMGNSGATTRLPGAEPTPYPTTVGTTTVGMLPGAEVPANLGGKCCKFDSRNLSDTLLTKFHQISHPRHYRH